MRVLLVASIIGLLLLGSAGNVAAAPLRFAPGLLTVTAYEVTGVAIPQVFGAAGPQVTAQLPGVLGAANRDFFGLQNEHYDIFYSDANGGFDIDGEYLTVECTFDQTFGGGGGNIAEVSLDFSSGSSLYAVAVVSNVTLGGNAIPASVGNAADGNLATLTTLGNTAGTAQRLRVTLCYNIPGYTLPSCHLVGVENTPWEGVKSLYR